MIPATRVAGIAACLMLMSCDDNRTGHFDLPENKQTVDVSPAEIISNPDGFPNLAHKCLDTTGFWTTTDRTVIIIYNDHTCAGANLEAEMTVINGVAQRVVVNVP